MKPFLKGKTKWLLIVYGEQCLCLLCVKNYRLNKAMSVSKDSRTLYNSSFLLFLFNLPDTDIHPAQQEAMPRYPGPTPLQLLLQLQQQTGP